MDRIYILVGGWKLIHFRVTFPTDLSLAEFQQTVRIEWKKVFTNFYDTLPRHFRTHLAYIRTKKL